MFYNIFSYITHLIHDETLFNFKYHVRNEGLIFFIHLHSAPCDFISSFLSFSLSSLLFLALCLYLSLCLSVYLYQSIYISTLVSVSKCSFITRTKQKQIRPVSDVYNVRQTSEKKIFFIDRSNPPLDGRFSKILFSSPLQKKKWRMFGLRFPWITRFYY